MMHPCGQGSTRRGLYYSTFAFNALVLLTQKGLRMRLCLRVKPTSFACIIYVHIFKLHTKCILSRVYNRERESIELHMPHVNTLLIAKSIVKPPYFMCCMADRMSCWEAS